MKLRHLLIFPLLATALIPLRASAQDETSQRELPMAKIADREFYYYDVKKDESSYGIAKRFGWDSNILLKTNPDVYIKPKEGERMFYPADGLSEISEISKEDIPEIASGVISYTLQADDNLSDIAKRYRTSVESIFLLNQGLTPNNLKAGETVKIRPYDLTATRTEHSEGRTVYAFKPYKLNKEMTWSQLSQETGVELVDLKEANRGVHPKKHAVVSVPKYEGFDITHEVIDRDPREKDLFGIMEIYRETHPKKDGAVKVLLMLADPESKKDLDFARGFLLAVNDLKNSRYQIDVEVETMVRALEKLERGAADYDMILATCEKYFPEKLVSYGNENHILIGNLFDLKYNNYDGNPYAVHFLQPSEEFNSHSSEYLANKFSRRKVISIDANAEEDQIGGSFLSKPGVNPLNLSIDEFLEYELTPGIDYAIYASTTKRDDIERIVARVIEQKENCPASLISLIGRPAWVVYAKPLGDKFSETDLFIPSRFFLDENDFSTTNFNESYKEMYGFEPQPSFPLYAANGYDTGRWVIENLNYTGKDFNQQLRNVNLLQSPISMSRPGYDSALYNTASYILNFKPGGIVEKIMLK